MLEVVSQKDQSLTDTNKEKGLHGKIDRNGFFVPKFLITIAVIVMLAFVAIPTFLQISKKLEFCNDSEPGAVVEFQDEEIICPEVSKKVEGIKSELDD